MEKIILSLLTEDKENALIYTRYPSKRFLAHEREKGIQYCNLKEYNLYDIVESFQGDNFMEDLSVKRIIALAEKGKIDVVVLTSVWGYSKCQEETFWFFEQLHECGVKVDVIGLGSLDRAILDTYIEESKKQEQAFQNILITFINQWRSSGRGK